MKMPVSCTVPRVRIIVVFKCVRRHAKGKILTLVQYVYFSDCKLYTVYILDAYRRSLMRALLRKGYSDDPLSTFDLYHIIFFEM